VFADFKPRFTKRYANVTEVAVAGLQAYAEEIRSGAFPDAEHSYATPEGVLDAFRNLLEKRRMV
jgi:3-methyl-2-oxobutanoate hydroxymethyltransferase